MERATQEDVAIVCRRGHESARPATSGLLFQRGMIQPRAQPSRREGGATIATIDLFRCPAERVHRHPELAVRAAK